MDNSKLWSPDSPELYGQVSGYFVKSPEKHLDYSQYVVDRKTRKIYKSGQRRKD